MKLSLLTFIISALFSLAAIADADLKAFGSQCSGTDASDVKNCLKKESGKIDEANLPNEILISSEESGKESLLKLVRTRIAVGDEYSKKLEALVPMIKSSIATALIIQYETDPQLYYYTVDKNGKLEVVFDGINSVDITKTFKDIFLNEPDVLYLKAPNVSKTFLEWIDFLRE